MRDSKGPLAGIKVLDLGSYIAAPYGCTLLGDLGAEVIKIEPPGGDTLRHYPSSLQHESRAFVGINRNKCDILVDAKRPEGALILHRLVASADVIVHNFRPSVPERLGLDYPRLKTINPRLIYCALTGYGDSGPMKDKAGYDQVLQSMTGICAFQGESRGQPEIVYGSPVDFYAASMVAYAVTAALYQRERNGEGQYVSVSLLASALSMQSTRFVWADGEPRDASRDLRSGGITGIHPTKEGQIYLSANTPHFWRALCELVGLPEMAENPNYDSVRKRAERSGEIVPKIRAALLAHTALEWEQIFGERVPNCAVRRIEDMFDHPQVVSQGLAKTFEHPTVGQYRGLANPVKFSASEPTDSFAAPTLGQHTDEILVRYGFSEEEIDNFHQTGVVSSVQSSGD
ncbi:MAG TPA: CoA transferase [Candidatus Acidoferrales bacterium]|nr:CoA transferase [Candidatus Acidoferrales bacterium]